VPENEGVPISSTLTAAEGEENVTDEVTDKISALVSEKEASTDKEILMSDVRALVEETIAIKTEDAALPEIAPDEIKILNRTTRIFLRKSKPSARRRIF
jgi:hypothetical protein